MLIQYAIVSFHLHISALNENVHMCVVSELNVEVFYKLYDK